MYNNNNISKYFYNNIKYIVDGEINELIIYKVPLTYEEYSDIYGGKLIIYDYPEEFKNKNNELNRDKFKVILNSTNVHYLGLIDSYYKQRNVINKIKFNSKLVKNINNNIIIKCN